MGVDRWVGGKTVVGRAADADQTSPPSSGSTAGGHSAPPSHFLAVLILPTPPVPLQCPFPPKRLLILRHLEARRLVLVPKPKTWIL